MSDEASALVVVNDAISLVRSRMWIPLASLFINVIIRVYKNDVAVAWFPWSMPPRVRPFVAIGLGVASGFVAGLSSGSWGAAIAGGVFAGMLSITTHELVVESIRKGRDIGIPKAEIPPAMFPPGSMPP